MEGDGFYGGLMRTKFAAKRKIKRGEGIAPSPLLVAAEFLLSGVNYSANGSGADPILIAFRDVTGFRGALQLLIGGFLRAALVDVARERGSSERILVLVKRVRFRTCGIRASSDQRKHRGQ
jgi:hypothetical protein